MRSWRRRRLALSGDVVITLLGFCVAGDTSAGGQTPLTATPVDGAATAALFLLTDGNKPAVPDTAGVALSQAQPEAMPPNFSILGYGANIAVRTDGLHALPYWGLGMAAEEQSYCFLWRSNDVTSSQLPWKFVLEPSVAFFNDRLAVADLADELGPVLIAEAAVSPFKVVTQTNIGTADSRDPHLVTLSQGIACISHRMNTSLIVLDVAYRVAAGMQPQASGSSRWWTNSFAFQPDNGSIPSANVAALQGPDGLLWVFIARDSSGRIALARFSEGNGQLTLVDYDGAFLSNMIINGQPVDGPMAPHGELPGLCAVLDQPNGRILLSYESFGFNNWCGNYEAAPVITAVFPDKTKQLVFQSPDFVERTQPIPLVALNGGVSHILRPLPADCSTQPFQACTYLFGGGLAARQALPWTALPAYCQDGWCFTAVTNGFKFERLPSLTDFVVSWKPDTPGFALETVRPTLTITSPKAGLGVSNAMFIATGTARDNAAVASVFYQLNGGDWALADGATNWTATIHLAQRSNTLAVYAVDTSGNFSLTNRRTFTYVLSDRLQLATSGLGSVSPNYSDAFLEIGKSYKITARPGAGQVFSNWTGGEFADAGTVFAATNPLSFLMQSNLALSANFVSNPFLPRKGAYNGLFADFSSTNRNQGSSGFLTLKLTDRGTYSASLKSGNKQWPATGSFDVGGNSTLRVKRAGTNSLTVALSLDLASTIGLITGTVSDGIWQANLFADRAEFDVRTNPATQFAHKYTLIIPGGDLDGSPIGDSYGTLTVSPAGQLIFTGNLADGTPISQVVPVSQAGYWPFYQSLYGGLGSVWEWMKFDTNIPPDDLHDSGGISWIKPEKQTARYYPSGFNGFFYADGSIYTSPLTATNPVIALSNAMVAFQDGNLSAPFTNNVLVTLSSRIVNTSSNKLTMTVLLPSGKFTGNVTPPGMNKSIPIQGAVFQNTATAYGYFLGTNVSGSVGLTAPPSP